MKTVIAMLSVLFSTLEFLAQVLLAPLTLLTVVGLWAFTILMGRQVRLEAWRAGAASWKAAA